MLISHYSSRVVSSEELRRAPMTIMLNCCLEVKLEAFTGVRNLFISSRWKAREFALPLARTAFVYARPIFV